MKIKPYLWERSELLKPQAIIPSNINPYEYCEKIIGLPLAKHHKQWIDAIVTNCSNPYLNKISGNNLRISAPRGSAKTTLISTLLSWIIAHNQNIRIILCSYSEEVALAISVAIKNLIKSDIYRELFPHITPTKRWRDKAWKVNRTANNLLQKDPTLFAVGASGSIASRRADLIILDDPIKSSKDIANPAMRTAMVRWWSEVLAPTLVPDGRVIVLCTRYRVDDIHGTTFNEKNNWTVITQPAIIKTPNGEKSYWEEYMNLDYLQKLRNTNPVTFASQYQNNPVSEDVQIIKPNWIIVDSIPNKFEEIAIGVDLASSLKESAHETALVVCGRENNNYYLIEYDSGRWTLHQTIQKLLIFHTRYSQYRLTYQIESVAYQIAFVNEFKRVCINQGVRAKIEEVKIKGDKTGRLIGISGLFENHKIIFNEKVSTGKIIEQLLNFGYAEFDDLIDALIHSINKLYKKRKRLEGSSY